MHKLNDDPKKGKEFDATYAVTLGTRSTSRALRSSWATGARETGSASNARSTLEEKAGFLKQLLGEGTVKDKEELVNGRYLQVNLWHQVDHQYRGCPKARERRKKARRHCRYFWNILKNIRMKK